MIAATRKKVMMVSSKDGHQGGRSLASRRLSMRNVAVQDSVETYQYLAVGKRQIVVVEARSHEPLAQAGP